MSKSNLVAFRVPADLQDAFNQAVASAGGDKTAWLVDALRNKLSQPESNPQSRMLALVERMEVAAAALAGGNAAAVQRGGGDQDCCRYHPAGTG